MKYPTTQNMKTYTTPVVSVIALNTQHTLLNGSGIKANSGEANYMKEATFESNSKGWSSDEWSE